MTYGGNYYVYALNLMGDVVAILNTDGEAVVEYTYDAWGNILSVTGDMASTLGQLNPLRYRSYVYDRETQLYYLQSRYYDPEIGRFINADGLVSTGQGILGNNMYAYCGNNPVANVDYTGQFFERTAGGGGGGLAYAGPASGHIVRPTTPSANPIGIPFIPLPPSTTTGIDSLRAETLAIKQSQSKDKARAISKVETIVTKKSNTRYWTATIRATYVDIGRPLTFNQATHEVQSGRDVFAVTRWEAKNVAIAAGGRTGINNKKLFSEINRGMEFSPGYYYHYHTFNRKGGHVFYLFG